MKIKMPRGDYKQLKFKIENRDGTELGLIPDNIYITFKTNNRKGSPVLFQKTLVNGEIVKQDDGYYYFSIDSEDTDSLNFQEYGFDIEIVNETPKIKQTIVGTLQLTDEYTFRGDE